MKFKFVLLCLISLCHVPIPAESALLRLGTDPGFMLAYHEDAHEFFKGFSIPLVSTYSHSDHGWAFVGAFQYSFLRGSYVSAVTWTDPLTLENRQHLLNIRDTYHTFKFSTGFDFVFPFNWQEEQRKFLKYFLPYLGTDLAFFFPVISRTSDLREGQIPGLFYKTYKDQNRALTPTIGLAARLGTRFILHDRDKLNLMFQYAILIPEQTTSKLYLNHFLSISLGYERRLLIPHLTKKILVPEKTSGK